MGTFTPETYKSIYSKDIEKKTFIQYQLKETQKELLTELIRIEKNNGYNSITGADNLLRVRNMPNWTKCLLTGLRPTGTPDFYYSDLLIRNVKSLLVVYLPPDYDRIEIRTAPQFYPHNATDRTRIVNEIIKNW